MTLPNNALILVADGRKAMTDRPIPDIEALLIGEAAPPS